MPTDAHINDGRSVPKQQPGTGLTAHATTFVYVCGLRMCVCPGLQWLVDPADPVVTADTLLAAVGGGHQSAGGVCVCKCV